MYNFWILRKMSYGPNYDFLWWVNLCFCWLISHAQEWQNIRFLILPWGPNFLLMKTVSGPIFLPGSSSWWQNSNAMLLRWSFCGVIRLSACHISLAPDGQASIGSYKHIKNIRNVHCQKTRVVLDLECFKELQRGWDCIKVRPRVLFNTFKELQNALEYIRVY